MSFAATLMWAALTSGASEGQFSEVVWLAPDSETTPEMGWLFKSNGLFRSCVWLDEERMQTDFGRWQRDGKELVVDLDREGDAHYIIQKISPDSLKLSVPGRTITLRNQREGYSNRCTPVLRVWDEEATEYDRDS